MPRSPFHSIPLRGIMTRSPIDCSTCDPVVPLLAKNKLWKGFRLSHTYTLLYFTFNLNIFVSFLLLFSSFYHLTRQCFFLLRSQYSYDIVLVEQCNNDKIVCIYCALWCKLRNVSNAFFANFKVYLKRSIKKLYFFYFPDNMNICFMLLSWLAQHFIHTPGRI